jgi:phosphoglycerol transferase MdoB-like AlkP superfamily enzyme
MPRPTPLPEKARWLVLVAGLTASIPLYAVVVFVLASSAEAPADPAPAGLRYGFYGAAFALALLALAVAPRVSTDAATALPFDAFLRRTLLALVISEAAAILGLVLFFLGRNLADFLVLAGLALAVSLVGIVPRGLRWFHLREEPRAGGAPPISPG